MFNSLYELKIEGKDVKRFIKNLCNKNIYFENIIYDKNCVYVKVNKDNYKKIREIKTIYKIKIYKLYGLYKIKNIIYKNNIFFICIILSIFILNILCNLTFDIEIDSDNLKIINLLEKELDKHGIKKYSFMKNYNKRKEIINNILNDNKEELEWLEIERKGTKYNVRVEERIIKNEKETCTARNIIAKRDGIIMSISSSSGEIRKYPNDYVKKGDVIISGIITKDEEEKNKVCATGKIYAETWYQVQVEVPYNYKELINTGKKKKNISVSLFNKKYSLFKNFTTFKTKEISIKNNILPIKLSIEENEKINKIDHIYTEEELTLKAIEISKEKILSILADDSSILLEKKLKTSAKNSTIEMVIFLKVKENITDYQNIE